MWPRFNAKKEGTGSPSVPVGPLENKTVDVGKHQVSVRHTLAQGGFAYVYLAKCTQTGKSYALKHLVCGSEKEVRDASKKEKDILVALKGHPNVVTLVAHSLLEGPACLAQTTPGGHGKHQPVEYLLLLEYCERNLVSAMDARGGLWFDEKTVLVIFRDVCNALYAMHSQSPPIAHRDIKAENVLQSSKGQWKLCDFGSATSKHGRVERIEDMGVEEDTIRRTTTPAYRAPEMWDLYQKEVLSEKVDIWAMGCLLYRIAFFKSCFDGDSKLQVLNGRYTIPDANRFSAPLVQLIKDMLAPQPEARPTALEVWKRVNSLLPPEARHSGGPDASPKPYKAPGMKHARAAAAAAAADVDAALEFQRQTSSSQKPSRTSPTPPVPPAGAAPGTAISGQGGGASVGTFWAAFADDAPAAPPPPSPASASSAAAAATAAAPVAFCSTVRAATAPNLRRESSSGGESSSNPDGSGSNATRPGEVDQGSVKKGSAEVEVERLRSQLKKVLGEREELKANNTRLNALVQEQAQEIRELKSKLVASGGPGKVGGTASVDNMWVMSNGAGGGGAGTARRHTDGTMADLTFGANEFSASANFQAALDVNPEPSSEARRSLQPSLLAAASAAPPSFAAPSPGVNSSFLSPSRGTGINPQGTQGWDAFSNSGAKPMGWTNF